MAQALPADNDGRCTPPQSKLLARGVAAISHNRFETAYKRAPILPLDRSTPLILLSDSHRGDNGLLDRFAPNKPLFLHALTYYMERGYTYIEVGDGDELWHTDRFEAIQQAHPAVFELLQRFYSQDRLHMIIGNHDIGRERHLTRVKCGIPQRMGLRLEDHLSGRELFMTHGHQADMQSGNVSRLMYRHIAKPFQLMSQRSHKKPAYTGHLRRRLIELTAKIEARYDERVEALEMRARQWAATRPNLSLFSGHTHRPHFARGNSFNLGSCIEPGLLTGIEISAGRIQQICWTTKELEDGRFRRQVTQTTSI